MRTTKHGFKTPEVAMTFLHLQPTLILVIGKMIQWCDKRGLPFVITSAVRNFEQGQVSQTHPEGRAVDISVKGWTANDIYDFEKEWEANEIARKYGAVKADGTVNLAHYHTVAGGAPHFHVQIRPNV